jgi:hypothetical protein
MSAPGIELRWGRGFEENKPRKRDFFRHFIREAIDLAVEGIDDVGLSFSDRKYMVVDQVGPKEKWKGEALGKTCHIYLRSAEIQRKRVDTVWLAANIFHELVHLIHYEHVNEDVGMIEMAALEGVAYVADYDFANSLLARNGRTGPPHRAVEKIRSIPKRDLHKIEFQFWKDSSKPDENSNLDRWFYRSPRPFCVPRGAIVGVSAVSRQVERGWSIPELVELPPHNVLDAA